MFSFGESVIFEAVVTGSEDAHGNPVETWGAPVTVEGCAFAPAGSIESVEPGRNPVVTSPTVFAPAGTAVSARDRVTVRGLLYQVDGDPAVWHNPYTGSDPGVAITLERVGG